MTLSSPAKRATQYSAANLFLDNQLCFALYSASLAMTKVYRPLLTPLGLTYPQYLVMLALWEHRELSAGALGERVALDSGTLVPLIRRLQRMGLVDRRRSTIDDRSVLVSLTTAGRRLSKRAHSVHDQAACSTGRSAGERRALTQNLQTLRRSLLQTVMPTRHND